MKEQKKTAFGKAGLTTYQLTLTGLMTALLCVLGPVSLVIPTSPVPISLGSLGVCLAAEILGAGLGTLSCLLYLLLGMVGLPVFSGYTGGLGKLAGPTGGYLIGFLLLALIAGMFTGRFTEQRWKNKVFCCLGMLLGTAVLYLTGTFWLARMAGMNFEQALWAGVIPFIPGDVVKIVIATVLGTEVHARLVRAGLLAGARQKSH